MIKKLLVISIMMIILAMASGCTEQQVEDYKTQHPEVVGARIPTTLPTPTPIPVPIITTIITTTTTTEPTLDVTQNTTQIPTEIPTPTPTANETPTISLTPAITPTENQTPTPTPAPTQTTLPTTEPTVIPTTALITPEPTPSLSYQEQIRSYHPAFGHWKIDQNMFISGDMDFQVTSVLYPANGFPCGYGGANLHLSDVSLGYDSQFFIVPQDNQNEVKYTVILTLNGDRTTYGYFNSHRDDTITIDIIYRRGTDKMYFDFNGNELILSRV